MTLIATLSAVRPERSFVPCVLPHGCPGISWGSTALALQ